MRPTSDNPAPPAEFATNAAGWFGEFASGRRSRLVKTAVLGVLVCLWLGIYACRLLTVGFPPNDVRFVGTMAADVVDGSRLPLRAYWIPDYSTNGHLTYGALLTPIYAVFGSRYLWIVLLGSLLVVLGLAEWAWAVYGAWGFSCAAFFLCLCIGPPAFFEVRSHRYFWGTHIETIFFSGAALLLFRRGKTPTPGFWQTAALAMLAAWSVSFNIQNLPLVATLIVLTVWRHGRLGLVRLAWPAAPVFAGFSALFQFVFGQYLRLPGVAALPSGAAVAPAPRLLEKLYGLFGEALPRFLSFSGPPLWNGKLARFVALDGEAATAALPALFYGLTLAGLAAAAVAALSPPPSGWLKRRLDRLSFVDWQAHDGGRPEEKVWLTRFVAVLFALWVGAYAVAAYRIDLREIDQCRYLLPMYPVLAAAFCYAAAFLPAVAKWLIGALIVFAGLTAFADAWTSPAENWRELNAQRGDDYAYFIWSNHWRSVLADLGGGEAAIRALPRPWQEFAWIAFGANMRADEAARWRENPGDAATSPARRDLIATGRGQMIGARLCCSGQFAAEEFPAGALEASTAAALLAGIGYGCFQTSCLKSKPDCTVIGITATTQSEFTPATTCDPPNVNQELRLAQQRLGLSSEQARDAFLAGLSTYLGATNQALDAARREQLCGAWAAVFSADSAAGCPATFREGLAEGLALEAMNHFRVVTLHPDPEHWPLAFHASLADWPAVRAALQRRGVAATPLDETGRRYAMRFPVETRSAPGYAETPKPGAMVRIPGGVFAMGCSPDDADCRDDEKPPRQVTVRRFWMDPTPVTQAQYRSQIGVNPSRFSGCDDCPVANINWREADGYCKHVGKRLPTEAEWEFAARGGTKAARYGDLDAIAWYGGDSGGQPHPVAQKQPNAYGLYDMLGNVWEWCADWYDAQRRFDWRRVARWPWRNPHGPWSGQERVLRGGAWYDYPFYVRASGRNWDDPESRSDYVGFRCVRD
jgi:formylglycine-generating enzyme required for sulfatase activity